MSDTLLRLPQVIEKTGLCRSAIYDHIKREIFPKPVKISAQSVAWKSSEIADWIDSRPRALAA